MAELNLHFTGETITDPLYGQIPLTLVEDELRKTVEFGRLMKIKQLGSARYVYPSANHTRESHSFGCMYLIDKITRVLAEKLEEKSTPVIESRDLENFRVAALLHDLGHGPFSHSIESVLERNSIFRPSVKTIDGSSRPAVRHEDFTIDFLLSNGSEVSRVLDKHMIKKQDIASLISGKYNGKLRNFGQLLSSDVDVDRIDYVLRDMYHIGANWKDIININSLMSSFDTEFSDYYDSYIIYVTESQMANVDLFLHLRSIFIFTLPLNQRVHCSDFMLARAMEYALEKEEDPKKKVREIFTKMNDDVSGKLSQPNLAGEGALREDSKM